MKRELIQFAKDVVILCRGGLNMHSLSELVLILCNIRQSKIKCYEKFINGFLIEQEGQKYLKWELSKSIQMYQQENKIILISSKQVEKQEGYAIILQEDEQEFVELIGSSVWDMLCFLQRKGTNLKSGFGKRYLMVILYYMMLPIMLIAILCKLSAKENKEKGVFNYYNTVDLPKEIYNKILESHCPSGFDLDERREVLRKEIEKLNIDGPWLDLGCGVNPLLLQIKPNSNQEVYLLDPNQEAQKAYCHYRTRYQEDKVKFISGCGESLPFDDNYFSFIYCGGVIAHVCYLKQFVNECKRVLKPNGVILFDESNEYPRKQFAKMEFTKRLDQEIKKNVEVSGHYEQEPPKGFVCNPWAYWGCSTDHFWIFSTDGMYEYLQHFFDIKKVGAIGSYLRNNGTCESFPLFYPLHLGNIMDTFLDFKNLPRWYIRFLNWVYDDTGIYMYMVCKKNEYI